MSRWKIAALLLACSAAAGAQDAPSAPQTAADAGRKVYTSYCVRCHGIELRVGSSAFYDLRTFPKDDKARFVESVMKGKRAMPAWDGIVTAQQVDELWAYISRVNGW